MFVSRGSLSLVYPRQSPQGVLPLRCYVPSLFSPTCYVSRSQAVAVLRFLSTDCVHPRPLAGLHTRGFGKVRG